MTKKAHPERTFEIKRLHGLGWPTIAIAHQLRCSEQLVAYHLDPANQKAKTGVAKGTKRIQPVRIYGRDLSEFEINQIYEGQGKYDNFIGIEWCS